MEYNTVYNIGDEVWFMHDNKPCSGKISQVCYSKYISPTDHKFCVSERYRVRNVPELFTEESFFESKEDLLDSL